MAKSLYGYTIGANINEQDAPAGVKIVPDNKTLISLQLNDEPDDTAEPRRHKNMKEIFEEYKPQREIDLKTKDGDSEDMVFKFNGIKDFTKDGLIEQSPLLKELEEEEGIYSKFKDVLQTNPKLKGVINNPEHKKEFVELLEALIEELGGDEK